MNFSPSIAHLTVNQVIHAMVPQIIDTMDQKPVSQHAWLDELVDRSLGAYDPINDLEVE